MARESVPRFDLYGELEVSRWASIEVIEAAYRSLAKRHHPDVSGLAAEGSDSGDRIKRLNLAREWLTDPDRRRRYDRAMGLGPSPRPAVRPASSVRTARSSSARTARTTSEDRRDGDRGGSARRERDAGEDELGSFGPNSERVRQFLADLRALDELRALQLRAGRFSVMHPEYTAARKRLHEVGREQRQAESRFAREAADVIARGKVSDASLAEEIATVASDIAAAISLRDLLSRHDFELLLAPWTWRGVPLTAFSPLPAAGVTPPPAPRTSAEPAEARPVVPAAHARSRAFPPRSPVFAAGLTLVVVAVLAGGIALVNRAPMAIADGASPASTAQVGSATDAPTGDPSPPETAAPATLPPTPGIDPATLRGLQRDAARTIRDLVAAAAAGDVGVARELLGDSAPGLQVSGLTAATFPDVVAANITVVEVDGGGWLATAADDVLRSTDGVAWAFDYGDRPLAIFGGTPDHDLFWLDPRHDLYLRVLGATVTRSEVRLRFAWSGGDPFFDGARLWLSSLTIGRRSLEPGPEFDARLQTSDGEAVLVIPGTLRGASTLALDAAVTPSNGFTNLSTFELSAR